MDKNGLIINNNIGKGVFVLTGITVGLSTIIYNTVTIILTILLSVIGAIGLICKNYRFKKRSEIYKIILEDEKLSNIHSLRGSDDPRVVKLMRSCYITKKYIDYSVVESDLKRLVQMGVYPEGIFKEDGHSTYFIPNNEAYNLYLEGRELQDIKNLKVKNKDRVIEEVSRKTIENTEVPLELGQKREVVIQGRKLINELTNHKSHGLKDKYKDSLEHMIILLTKIFNLVEKENIDNSKVDRLVNYFLPLTLKLLDSYGDLSGEGLGLDNVQMSKREVEESLLTLCNSYKLLLNDLYQESRLDIVTDIEVMKTILKQEGLLSVFDPMLIERSNHE